MQNSESISKIEIRSQIYLNFCPKCRGSIFPNKLPQELVNDYCSNCGESFDSAIPRVIPSETKVFLSKNCNVICDKNSKHCMICGDSFHEANEIYYNISKYNYLYRNISLVLFLIFSLLPLISIITKPIRFLFWNIIFYYPNYLWFSLFFQISGTIFGILDLKETKKSISLILNIITLIGTFIVYILSLINIIP